MESKHYIKNCLHMGITSVDRFDGILVINNGTVLIPTIGFGSGNLDAKILVTVLHS